MVLDLVTDLFMGLEPGRAYTLSMKNRPTFLPIPLVLALVLALILASVLALVPAPGGARAQGRVVASPWLDFREAQIRLLADLDGAGGSALSAGLEIRLAPGFKTYWRNAGDSGVPPQFDFSGSRGLEQVTVAFPFPARFDDGAGGKAWGYKHNVILPVSARRTGPAPILALKIDFAVCGTMCIPLSGALELDPAAGAPVTREEAAAFSTTIGALPAPAPGTPRAMVSRRSGDDPPRWIVRLPYAGAAGDFSAFPEGKGFIDVTSVEGDGAGFVKLVLQGQSEPGAGGKFGPVRLTYGDKKKSFERMIDLDGAPIAP